MAPSLTIPRSVAGATCAALITLIATPVLGADLLRGGFYEDAPPPVAAMRWDGPYIGGFAGYASANTRFADEFQNTFAYLMRDSLLEQQGFGSQLVRPGSAGPDNVIYGGFGGYNVQADEVVYGFEIDYTRADLNGMISRSVPGSFFDPALGFFTGTNTVTSSTRLDDYVTMRGRVGYTIGNFMPFATLGIAIGRYSNAASAVFESDPPGFRIEESVRSRDRYEVGVAAGVGVDVALGPNIFLRGEYQFVTFQELSGSQVDINLVRGGAGIRF